MADRVLVVDDEPNLRRVLSAMLQREGYEVTLCADGEEGLAALDRDGADVVVTDLVMPKIDGLTLLRRALQRHPDVPVIVITAHGKIDSAVEAMKAGAFDFVAKPFEHAELKAIIAKAARQSDCNARNVMPEETQGEGRRYTEIVGRGSRMQELAQVIAKVADAPSTVLIQGESGTGKELVATALHEKSTRRDRPFIKINCAAIPRDLVEAELFGFERGAFTGAVQSKPGRFELADGGTLFLDEIGEVPMEMQVKLLRAIQESEFERVGGIRSLKISVRLIASTSRDLLKEIAAGRFREDLYYRLNVVPIQLPPLRERAEDIPLLVEHFREKYNARLGKAVARVEPEALAALAAYAWPGNIRELENILERTILFAEGTTIRASDLPPSLRAASHLATPSSLPALAPAGSSPGDGTGSPGGPVAPGPLKEIVREQVQAIERDLIVRGLEITGGNVTRTAKLLKISRKSLQMKMKEFGLRGDDAEK
jgi:DNA-binding NtrC family response regulator